MNKFEFINNKRKIINSIDDEILILLTKRYKAVSEIGKFKSEKGIKIIDKNREKEIIDKISKKFFNTDEYDFLISVYEKIFEASKKIQKNLKK